LSETVEITAFDGEKKFLKKFEGNSAAVFFAFECLKFVSYIRLKLSQIVSLICVNVGTPF